MAFHSRLFRDIFEGAVPGVQEDIVRTEEGAEDSLFGELPRLFHAQQGHNDRIVRLPPGTVCLATNANAPVQALRMQGKPIWATQFHPELTRVDNATRYKRYIQAYGGDGNPPPDDPVMATLRETPHPTDLLRRFGEMVLSGQV